MEKENKSKVFFDLGLAAKSQLSRKLLLLFLTIAIVEAAFVGLLAFGVVTAGKTAEREFKILALSQEAAGILKLARNAWLAGERAVYHPEKFGRYKELYEKVQTALEQLSDNMHKEGFRSMSLDDIRDSLQEISNFISQRITQGRSSGPATRQEAKELIDKSCLCYQSFLETVQQFQKLAKASASKSPLVIDSAILLWGSALTNLGFLILVALFMEREITRPVAGLIKNCQLLEKRELMPEPVHSSTEINALEKSFFEMSKTLNQNEKRRQSYIGLLRDVQEASLGGLSERIKVLSSDPQLPPKVQKMYSSFSNNVRNMLRLVAGMSESLSTEQTNINPQYEVISCASLLEQAKASVDSLCRERDITLDLKCKDEDVQLDQQLIGRVLLNFLSNAIKYSPEHAKVLLTAEPADEAALSARLPEHAVKAGSMIFYVEDHGPGMTAANVEKLFNKFVQVEAVDGVKRAGTGLGLAICKDIVDAHGGSVGCLSEPGKGSIFWFTVPKKKLASLSTGSNKPSSLPLGHVSGSLLNFPQSIKRSFVTTLLIFLLGQFGIALVLGYNFHQASEKAAIFANNKRVAFQTQELLGQWLVWNRKMMFAIMTMNFRLVRKITPLLEENVARADWLIDHTKGSPQVNEKLRTVKRNFLRFVRVSEKTVANSRSISPVSIMMLAQTGSKLATVTDREIFDSLELEKSDVDNAYEWAEDLRKNLVLALAASAVLHAILLAFVANSSLLILNKIAVLKQKSEDFSEGKALSPTLEGKDELSFLELRLYQTSETLKQAETDRQVLVATINHDLRTPVNSVLAGFEMIQEGVFGPPSAEHKPVLDSCVSDLLGLVRQINNLLLLEKIESGTYKMVKADCELSVLLERAVEQLSSETLRTGVEININCKNAELLSITADEQLLLELFRVVLLNAIQASPKGAPIVVNLTSSSEFALISIRDSGGGIAPELLSCIFNRFRFVDGKPIAGLGLPLAHSISKLHNGQISFSYSSAREGTCIEIALPISGDKAKFEPQSETVSV